MNEDMPESIGRDQLVRYVAGECDEAERARIEAWLGALPARRRLVASLAEVWRVTAHDAAWDVDAAWQAVQDRRGAREKATAERRRSGVGSWAVRAAAVLALLLGGALVLDRLPRGEVPTVASAAVDYSTGVAEQRAVTLEDGSVVVLAPESRLTVLSASGAGPRDVELTGQAVFQVTHDETRPFRVRAGALTTEVLGTRFGVRAYRDDEAITVALVEGSVRVSPAGDSGAASAITLIPGQIARAGDDSLHIDTEVSIAPWLAWTEGQLMFDDTPLTQVARDLSRWYGVDVQLADSTLAQRRLTGSFVREPIAQVIDLIVLSLGIRYESAGRGYVLTTR